MYTDEEENGCTLMISNECRIGCQKRIYSRASEENLCILMKGIRRELMYTDEEENGCTLMISNECIYSRQTRQIPAWLTLAQMARMATIPAKQGGKGGNSRRPLMNERMDVHS